MNTAAITIEEGRVRIRQQSDGVWLTAHEIADTFGVFISAVNSNIRSILKNGILREDQVCRRQENKDGSILTLYNLEMITALAFRLSSRPAHHFRKWITQQALHTVIVWKIPGTDNLPN